jgi:hypothetical protein
MPASVDILWVPLVWAAFRRDELSRTYRDVLLCLPRFRGKGGLIFPSHETVAQRANCSVSTVKRALEAGRALGLIDWKGVWRRVSDWASKRCSNLYSLIWTPTPAMENPMKSDIGHEEPITLRVDSFLLSSVNSRASLASIAAERSEKIAREWLAGRGQRGKQVGGGA